MYPENIQELIDAARQMLSTIKNITRATLDDISQAWDRLDKAIKTMEAQERNEDDTTRD